MEKGLYVLNPEMVDRLNNILNDGGIFRHGVSKYAWENKDKDFSIENICKYMGWHKAGEYTAYNDSLQLEVSIIHWDGLDLFSLYNVNTPGVYHYENIPCFKSMLQFYFIVSFLSYDFSITDSKLRFDITQQKYVYLK